jgi:hypothetical protein
MDLHLERIAFGSVVGVTGAVEFFAEIELLAALSVCPGGDCSVVSMQ